MDNEDFPEKQNENSATEDKSAISADLIRGHINTIILRTLYERDKYGYEIIEEIEKKSHGQYSLKQPTLYSALKRLETQGYINAYWKTDEVSLGGRRKYYTLPLCRRPRKKSRQRAFNRKEWIPLCMSPLKRYRSLSKLPHLWTKNREELSTKIILN
ncbi:MAG: PadR family transcriptional regulator [Clostridia bacterium]|nr:PadR family transcriptional regulator [Clostridia bacterium]